MTLEYFLIFRNAGQADLQILLQNDETRREIPVKVSKNDDGTYFVEYEAPQAGCHSVTLHYGGTLVPTTPIKFKVQPNVDVSKIIVDGLEPSKYHTIGHLFEALLSSMVIVFIKLRLFFFCCFSTNIL